MFADRDETDKYDDHHILIGYPLPDDLSRSIDSSSVHCTCPPPVVCIRKVFEGDSIDVSENRFDVKQMRISLTGLYQRVLRRRGVLLLVLL